MKKLLSHSLFISGLLVRLSLIVGMGPPAVMIWFKPFLDVTTSLPTLDPWSTWIASGGTPVAFPYGYAMWFAFLPITFLAKLISLPLEFAYTLSLLIADFLLLLTLNKLIPGRQRLLLLTYWWSPIVLLTTYVLGFNDLIPALLLVFSVLNIRNINFRFAGVFLALAISAKLSMVLALPFYLIYLFNNKALRQQLPSFILSFCLCILIFWLPFLHSAQGLKMLLGNPELGKIYQMVLSIGTGYTIYIAPLVYLIILYLAWRVRRLNFVLFQATIGIAFLLVVLMTPASPGWLLWSLPFLVVYQASSDRIAILSVGLFSALYTISLLFSTPIIFADNREIDLELFATLKASVPSQAASLLHTAIVAIGLILVIRIWREAITRNDFFRLSRKPFILGVAGCSGAGKDTLADAITDLFGGHSVVKLSGDDYHLWDRQKPIWQVMTHLNPRANDLEGFCNDLISLTDGKSILSRHYDHKTGKKSRPFRIYSNDFVIASGLHTLYLPMLRECCNLKIYLDIDEGLRRHFALTRDVITRGHTIEAVQGSFENRESDSERFIRPQSNHADLILSLQPIHPRMLEDANYNHPPRLKLVVGVRNGFNELSTHRVLVGVCGLHVDVVVANNSSDVELTVEGDTSAADIAMAATILCPRIMEFLDIQPKWQDGMLGLMQLITLSHISHTLGKRFIT